MKKITTQIMAFEPLTLASRIRDLRKKRGWNQAQFGEAVGVTQGQVSRWEAGTDRPTSVAVAAIAAIADDCDRALWVAETGMSQLMFLDGNHDDNDLRQIPVLKDAAAAGTPRAIDPASVEAHIALPRRWLPRSGKLYLLHVKGDSMAPIVNDGYLVMVNVAERRPMELIGRMVAARDGEGGVTIKWLRRDDEIFFLVPNNTSERHPIHVLRDEGQWSIIGEVVKIIGDPPAPRKTKGA